MTKNSALIWDLDGTLLDSYDVIMGGLCSVCDEYHYPYDKDAMRQEIITYSVSHFLINMAEKTGIPYDTLHSHCSKYTRASNNKVFYAINWIILVVRILFL